MSKRKFFSGVFLIFVLCGIFSTLIKSFAQPDLAQENLIKGGHVFIDEKEFFNSSCKQKSICKKFNEVKSTCREAQDVDGCVFIKMEQEVTSMCTDDGRVSYLDESTMPTYVQCMVNWRISHILDQGNQ